MTEKPLVSLQNPNPELEKAQKQYQYNYNYIPPLAMVDKIPKGEGFSFGWLVLVGEEVFKLLVNYIAEFGDRSEEKIKNEVEGFFRETVEEKFPTEKHKLPDFPKTIQEVRQFLESLRDEKGKDFFSLFGGKAFTRLQEKSAQKTYRTLEEYNKLFVTLELPAIANNFQEDETFAYLRVAGPNPVVIEKMTAPDERFPVSEAQYQAVMGADDCLEVAIKEGRVYLTDYAVLDGAIDGTYPKYQKYLYAPLAMFAVPKGTGDGRSLRPVAIQCHQKPGPDNPILTPTADANAWLFAKTVVQVADANFHEAVTHLARTHLFIEPFVIATHRQLPDEHPLSLLLRPHFQGTLAINNAAQDSLIAAGGGVDTLLAAIIDTDRVLAVTGLQTYPFNQAMLPKELERRGVSDRDSLPVYPYRDDALLIWDAIHEWVSSYLSIHYASDLEVRLDKELQVWAAELIDFNGGRVIDFGEGNGGIQTLDYLIEATTLIIFTSSAQHAAVNFPQKSIMSYAPAMPLAGYAPAEVGREESSLLPPLDQAQKQLNLLSLLGSVYYTQLGKYDRQHFDNLRVEGPLREFQAKLREIESAIERRNAAMSLPFAYEYLLPSKIPQSINI